MVDTNKGQASSRSNFFHVTFRAEDKKWHAVDVHNGNRNSFSSFEEAFNQVKSWAQEEKKSAHVYIHDEHGKIREERTL